MCDDITEQRNMFIDQVIAERRSYRMFTPEIPPEDAIRRILHAGLQAPYAAAAVGTSENYFRRFFVMKAGSKSLGAAIPLVRAEVTKMAKELEEAMTHDPKLREQALSFVQRLDLMRKRGMVPGVGTAPYYIVVVEKRGFPPVGPQSLSHCLENMWLKATALGLGFHIVSLTARMAENEEFCKILGIAPGEWDLMGCAAGYPQDELSPSIRPPVEDLTSWLD